MDGDENGNVEPLATAQTERKQELYDRNTSSVTDCKSTSELAVKLNKQYQHLYQRKRRFCLSDKITALQRIIDGESRPKICREMGLAESTLRGWIKHLESESLMKAEEGPHSPGGDYNKTDQYVELDTKLYSWFLNEHESGQQISGIQLKLQAEKLFFSLNPGKVNFRHRGQFIQRFLIRHNIMCVCLTCKPHDSSIFVPSRSLESNVNCTGDASSDSTGISITSVVGNYSKHNMSAERYSDCPGESTSAAGINSKSFVEGDSSFFTAQHQDTLKNMAKSQPCHKQRNEPSSSTIVYYLEETLKWFQSEDKYSCHCSTPGTEELKKLLQMVKYKAAFEGQKKITDFFTKN